MATFEEIKEKLWKHLDDNSDLTNEQFENAARYLNSGLVDKELLRIQETAKNPKEQDRMFKDLWVDMFDPIHLQEEYKTKNKKQSWLKKLLRFSS